MDYIQEDEQTFVTGVPKKAPETQLRDFVNHLTSKIDYAKWKQSLVLGYNYMPMSHMIDKVTNERINYQRKLDQISEQCRKIVQDQNMLNQLESFRGFSKILQKRLQELSDDINTSKLRKQQLQKQVANKSQALKQSLKYNSQLQILTLRARGIQTKKDIVTILNLKASKSVSSFTHTKNSRSLTFNSQINRNLELLNRQNYQSQPRLLEKQQTIRKNITKKITKNNLLYLQCLDTILKIFPKESKNNIDNVLAPPNEIKEKKINVNKDLSQQSVKDIEDVLSWENFREMNYLQILDKCIHDPIKAYKLRKIL